MQSSSEEPPPSNIDRLREYGAEQWLEPQEPATQQVNLPEVRNTTPVIEWKEASVSSSEEQQAHQEIG